jgi:nitronate monooxygenase
VLNTVLTESWGLKYPLLQAPMAGVAGGKLAAAVSEAGGLGMIGVNSVSEADWVRREAAIAREAGKFGIGLMLWALPERPDLLDAVLESEPAVVSLSFGDPTPYVQAVREAGAKVVAQVQDGASAATAIAAGVDAVIAQGTEAGGHTGHIGTLPLLQIVLEMAQSARVPVLAAGGVGSGRGIAGVLAMGAAGVWVGTPFAATEEAMGTDEAKKTIIAARETDTMLTRVFDVVQEYPWPQQFPGRALANDFARHWHGREAELQASLREAQAEFQDARNRRDFSKANIYAGQSVGLVHEITPAGRLVESLMADADAILRGVPHLVE